MPFNSWQELQQYLQSVEPLNYTVQHHTIEEEQDPPPYQSLISHVNELRRQAQQYLRQSIPNDNITDATEAMQNGMDEADIIPDPYWNSLSFDTADPFISTTTNQSNEEETEMANEDTPVTGNTEESPKCPSCKRYINDANRSIKLKSGIKCERCIVLSHFYCNECNKWKLRGAKKPRPTSLFRLQYPEVWDRYANLGGHMCKTCFDKMVSEYQPFNYKNCSHCGEYYPIETVDSNEYRNTCGDNESIKIGLKESYNLCWYCYNAKVSTCGCCKERFVISSSSEYYFDLPFKNSSKYKLSSDLGGDIRVCSDCLESGKFDQFIEKLNLSKCNMCFRLTTKESFHKEYYDNGIKLCKHCYGAGQRYCKSCDSFFPRYIRVPKLNGIVDTTCLNCISKLNLLKESLLQCSICRDPCFNLHYLKGNRVVCRKCISLDPYNSSQDPNKSSHQQQGIPYQKYNYKPMYFYKHPVSNGLLFGTENEILCQNTDDKESKLSRLYRNFDERFLYCKHDGSLHDTSAGGFEVVTMPMSFDFIRHNFDYHNLVYNDIVYKCAGMHIHASKESFTQSMIYKMLKLIYDNKIFIDSIAGRKENSYCGRTTGNYIIHSAKRFKIGGETNHYSAVNMSNLSTVEFRLFKAATTPQEWMKNIEFVHAMYVFCYNTKLKDVNKTKLISFILENEKEYSNLAYFLRTIENI